MLGQNENFKTFEKQKLYTGYLFYDHNTIILKSA